MLKLPLGISTFSELIQSGYLYVDKTQHAYNMIMRGRRFFLSRPRRFGKSLLVSTLKEILTANKSLFNNLWIGKSDYDWHEYGIINLDFSKLKVSNAITLNNRLCNALETIAKNYNITIDVKENAADLMLEKLVFLLSQRFGKVAILVDEYDSPILKSLHNEKIAQEIRQEIQHFFTVIKGLDAEIQFVFITGVSSFAKAGLFSGINNLKILTLNDDYADICGYTDKEIDHYFTDYINVWAQQKNIPYEHLRQQIKEWYNGYHFGENVVSVYNPFSFMNALDDKRLSNFWFQSGTTTFLVEIIKKNEHTFDPEDLTTTEDALGIFDVGLTPLTTLMFQAGYLTITKYNPNSRLYTLDYPNAEVRISFQKYLLEVFAHIDAERAAKLSADLYDAFERQDIEKAIFLLYQLFAHVPYQLHMKAEKYYHSLFMMICVGAGMRVQSEYSTNLGRIDVTIELSKIIYVIEVKFNDTAENALAQIKERRYYERFMQQGKPIILLGLAFKRAPEIFDITYAIKKL